MPLKSKRTITCDPDVEVPELGAGRRHEEDGGLLARHAAEPVSADRRLARVDDVHRERASYRSEARQPPRLQTFFFINSSHTGRPIYRNVQMLKASGAHIQFCI